MTSSPIAWWWKNWRAQTTAELVDGQWVINGAKRYITSSGTDITAGITVTARTGERQDGRPELSAFLVPQDTPGYTRGPAYEKIGWRTSDQHPLFFKDCRVPEDHLLGDHVVPLGKARIVRPGIHLTVVTYGLAVHHALAAAETVAAEGVETEVIDLRTLRPLDKETL